MTVLVMHPDLYDLLQPREEAISSDTLVLLSRVVPRKTVQIVDLDAEGMLDWLQQMEESIAALQKD